VRVHTWATFVGTSRPPNVVGVASSSLNADVRGTGVAPASVAALVIARSRAVYADVAASSWPSPSPR
jgi:hypothetical protein